MPGQYSILAAILLCGFAVANGIAWQFFVESQRDRADVRTWRNTIILILGAAFLSPSPWLYFAILIATIVYSTRRGRLGEFYLLALFLVPYIPVELPRVGGAPFFDVNHARVLTASMVVLIWLRRGRASNAVRGGFDPVLICLTAYVCVLLGIALWFGNVTHTMRITTPHLLDLVAPFLVMRWTISSMADAKRALTALAFAMSWLALVGISEAVTGRLCFPALQSSWGISWPQFIWTTREGSLRAQASAAQPIAFGCMMVTGIVAVLAARGALHRRRLAMCLGVLAAGLVASLSRGPWLAGGIMAVLVAATSRRPLRHLGFMGAIAAGGVVLVLVSPYGESFVNLLPWIGKDTANIDFRENLLAFTLEVLQERPLVGYGFFAHLYLERFRTPEGIIDIVNSYAAVALSSGLLGLIPFIGAFVCALAVAVVRIRSLRRRSPELAHMLKMCAIGIVTVAVVIGTCASITVVPFLYLTLMGITSALARVKAEGDPVSQPAAVPAAQQPFVLPRSRRAASARFLEPRRRSPDAQHFPDAGTASSPKENG